LATVRDVLTERGLLEQAVIARHQPVPTDAVTVVWPADHSGDFTY
jgi:hypothetical protein